MKMRQSLADWEQAFHREASLDRRHRASLQRTAEQRTLKREVERRHKRGSVRFALLVLTLIMTAAIVTVEMFRTLYLLLGLASRELPGGQLVSQPCRSDRPAGR